MDTYRNAYSHAILNHASISTYRVVVEFGLRYPKVVALVTNTDGIDIRCLILRLIYNSFNPLIKIGTIKMLCNFYEH